MIITETYVEVGVNVRKHFETLSTKHVTSKPEHTRRHQRLGFGDS